MVQERGKRLPDYSCFFISLSLEALLSSAFFSKECVNCRVAKTEWLWTCARLTAVDPLEASFSKISRTGCYKVWIGLGWGGNLIVSVLKGEWICGVFLFVVLAYLRYASCLSCRRELPARTRQTIHCACTSSSSILIRIITNDLWKPWMVRAEPTFTRMESPAALTSVISAASESGCLPGMRHIQPDGRNKASRLRFCSRLWESRSIWIMRDEGRHEGQCLLQAQRIAGRGTGCDVQGLDGTTSIRS